MNIITKIPHINRYKKRHKININVETCCENCNWEVISNYFEDHCPICGINQGYIHPFYDLNSNFVDGSKTEIIKCDFCKTEFELCNNKKSWYNIDGVFIKVIKLGDKV